MALKALRDFLVIEPIKKEDTIGQIYVGEGIDKSLRGRVTLVGQEVKEISVGDTVVYYDGMGLKLTEEGKDLILIKETEISLVV